ncbi:hypothetical protein [Streptomyces sp. NPDC049585]|uniref:hypothetical protein n=1 Tax=Streptomyces sp. NPDC049585 TaxID=3155154 RepID=UPI003417B7DF
MVVVALLLPPLLLGMVLALGQYEERLLKNGSATRVQEPAAPDGQQAPVRRLRALPAPPAEDGPRHRSRGRHAA